MPDRVPFAELAVAAYCPRKLYYRRRDPDLADPPPVAGRARDLARRYGDLAAGVLPADLAAALAVSPVEARATLRPALERWPGLRDPVEEDVVVTGREVRGRVAKVLPGDPPVPTLVSPGRPPERGVWKPQRVRAVAAAKALSWREERPVDLAFVEYARHGVVRPVRLTTRRKAEYRRTLRAVRALDGPPPRLRDRAKCDACEVSDRCGVRTRTLRSLL